MSVLLSRDGSGKCFGKFEKNLFKEIVYYSFWVFLSGVMTKVFFSTGKFVLGVVSGTIAVSVFAIAIHMVTMYVSFPGSISGVFLPRITSLITNHKSNVEISDLFIRIGRIQYIAIMMVFSGFVIFGKTFFDLWAGKEYAESFKRNFIVKAMFYLD